MRELLPLMRISKECFKIWKDHTKNQRVWSHLEISFDKTNSDLMQSIKLQ